jgi:hypothetical protein
MALYGGYLPVYYWIHVQTGKIEGSHNKEKAIAMAKRVSFNPIQETDIFTFNTWIEAFLHNSEWNG